jgi:tRNA (Thr-GGU) A37 N-methylase
MIIKLDPRFKNWIEGIDKFWNIIVEILNHASNAKPPKARDRRAK